MWTRVVLVYTVGLEYYITGHFLGWLDNVGITEFLDVFFCSVIFVRLDALALSVIATATWLAGWAAVRHSRYCIKTTKPIRKLFGPSGRPII